MNQNSPNYSLNSMFSQLMQRRNSEDNNGLKANILEINFLIELLDCPYNEILSYLTKDRSLSKAGFRDLREKINTKSLSNSNSFSNKSNAARVTQDLDHLLTSLSQYKLNRNSHSNLYDDQRDNMGQDYLYLEDVRNIDFKSCDISSSNAATLRNSANNSSLSIVNCQLCNEPIFDNSVAALNGYWHQHHFICYSCEVPLSSAVYYVNNQQLFCETCHINLFTDNCAFCQEPILDKSLSALNKHWHPEHFFCASCQGPFDNNIGYHEHLEKPYCPDCYFDLFGTRCSGCNQPITSTFLSVMGKKWHDDCLVCKECQMPFETLSYYEIDGYPYCTEHYYIKMGMICDSCNLPITTCKVNALGKKFHPKCFTCAYCLKNLARCTLKEIENRLYCTECFGKLCF